MPRYGFNFQWMFSCNQNAPPQEPDLRALDFLAKHDFNFVRLPTDYRYWTANHNYFDMDEDVLEIIDQYLTACAERNIQMSLNIHRAPGYCINRPDIEKHDLWFDTEAQDGFVYIWEQFAKRYQGHPSNELSFDLLNEPPDENWGPPHSPHFSRDMHEKVMRRTIAAIRNVDPDREIVLNGISGGGMAIPELADLGRDNVVHSGRGYAPAGLTHYKAEWASHKHASEAPSWPFLDGDKLWDKAALRDYYEPWREVEAKGVTIHIGEFGCYNKTSNNVALAWFEDLLSLYHEYGWGYSLWGFEKAFGIIDHGRSEAAYEGYEGYKLDRKLFSLLSDSRRRQPFLP